MGHWDFSDGPYCEDFDEAEARDYSSTPMLWRERAAQKDAKTAGGKQETRSGSG